MKKLASMTPEEYVGFRAKGLETARTRGICAGKIANMVATVDKKYIESAHTELWNAYIDLQKQYDEAHQNPRTPTGEKTQIVQKYNTALAEFTPRWLALGCGPEALPTEL